MEIKKQLFDNNPLPTVKKTDPAPEPSVTTSVDPKAPSNKQECDMPPATPATLSGDTVSTSTATTPSAPDPTSALVDKLLSSDNPNRDMAFLSNHLERSLPKEKAEQFRTNLNALPPKQAAMVLDEGPPPVGGVFTPKEALKKMAELLEKCKDDPERRQALMKNALKLAEQLAEGGGC